MMEKRTCTFTSSEGDALCCVRSVCEYEQVLFSPFVNRCKDSSVRRTFVSISEIHSKVFGRMLILALGLLMPTNIS